MKNGGVETENVKEENVTNAKEEPKGTKQNSKGTKEEKKQRLIDVLRDISSHPAFLVLCICLFAFIYHPKWMNMLYFRGRDNIVPLNYVSNFYLWTRNNRDQPEQLKVGSIENLLNSNFNPRKTFILIHGFTKNGLEKWILDMKTALLWREDCNVISADWDAGSLTASYYVIQARVPGVGEDVSKLVTFLRDQWVMSGEEFHLIGHSLGAHAAGFAGKTLNGTIGRITGLDPAGLAYNGVAAPFRLDGSDAKFVDVIHTHGCYTFIGQWTDCYGTYESIGDVDFWPNGGEYQRPPCEEGGDGRMIVQEGSNCDHGIVCDYFTQSIYYYPTTTIFLARHCSSYESFNNGSCPCPQPPQYMGYNAVDSEIGDFYLNTTQFQPYGKLEPMCTAARLSLLKILGFIVCFNLTVMGLAYGGLFCISKYTKRDLLSWIKHKLKNRISTNILRHLEKLEHNE